MPPGYYTRGLSLEERFWSKVDKSGDCWLFQTNTLLPGGYGRFKVDGKMVLVHRHAYELQHGPLEKSDNVFQTCRNKLCVRKEHLVAGSKNSGPREERPTEPPPKGRYASHKWKDIPDHLGYEASVEGEIRSWWVHGRELYAKKPRVLQPTLNLVNGYLYVNLRRTGGDYQNRLLHRVVLETFVGPCPEGMEVRHFPDGDRTNNALKNLSYVDHQQNMDDQLVHGTRATGDRHGSRLHPESRPRGERHYTKLKPERIKYGSTHPNAKLTTEQYDHVVALLAEGLSQRAIAEHVGVSQAVISDINTGKRKRE